MCKNSIKHNINLSLVCLRVELDSRYISNTTRGQIHSLLLIHGYLDQMGKMCIAEVHPWNPLLSLQDAANNDQFLHLLLRHHYLLYRARLLFLVVLVFSLTQTPQIYQVLLYSERILNIKIKSVVIQFETIPLMIFP